MAKKKARKLTTKKQAVKDMSASKAKSVKGGAVSARSSAVKLS